MQKMSLFDVVVNGWLWIGGQGLSLGQSPFSMHRNESMHLQLPAK